jgi:hypothetical protein
MGKPAVESGLQCHLYWQSTLLLSYTEVKKLSSLSKCLQARSLDLGQGLCHYQNGYTLSLLYRPQS